MDKTTGSTKGETGADRSNTGMSFSWKTIPSPYAKGDTIRVLKTRIVRKEGKNL